MKMDVTAITIDPPKEGIHIAVSVDGKVKWMPIYLSSFQPDIRKDEKKWSIVFMPKPD